MPSIVQGYECDVFISYRRNDNLSGWVSEFVQTLREELASTIKYPVSVYFDSNPHDGLLETHSVDKTLERKLKGLIFLPVLSQTYCDPSCFAWNNEFIPFRNLAEKDTFGLNLRLGNGNIASRILPVRIHDLEIADQTLFEKESRGVLRAIDFIFRSPGVNRPLRSKDDDVKEINHALFYRDQINKLANAIREMMAALKNPQAKSMETVGNSRTATHEAIPDPSVLTLKQGRIFLVYVIGIALVLLAGLFSLPADARFSFPIITIFSLVLGIGLVAFFSMGHSALQSKGRKMILALVILSVTSIFIHFIFTDDIAITVLVILGPFFYYYISRK